MLFLPRFQLRSERLLVRLPLKRDFQSWKEARVSSYEVLQPVEPRWLEHMHERRSFLATTRKAVTDFREQKAIRCLILLPDNLHVIGGVNLSRLEWGAKRAGLISYWLKSSHQSQGYMGEALKLVIDYAFGELELNRIEAEVMSSNKASVRTLKHLNFAHEGTCKQNIKIAGKWEDHERYALLSPS